MKTISKNMRNFIREKKDAVETLFGYPEDSAGGRMTTAFATVREDMTVKETIESLEEIKEDAEILARMYVIDDNEKILGKVRLRDLTFNKWSTPIKDIADHEQISISAEADQEEALKLMVKYDMLALPVVDSGNNCEQSSLTTHLKFKRKNQRRTWRKLPLSQEKGTKKGISNLCPFTL